MCVSKSWHALISDPDYLDSMFTWPSLFFLRRHDGIGFVTSEGDGGLPLVDSALSFLPAASTITLLDSCNGLLLLRCSPAVATRRPAAFYVVCNPSTQEWAALPQPSVEPGFDNNDIKACTAALGFDPSISCSRFHVFQIEEEERMYNYFVRAVEIYSSETGTWARKETRWPYYWVYMTGHKTYFNGFLHLTVWELGVIAMVDTKGQAWRTIAVPSNGFRGSVSHSQGHLVYVDVRAKQIDALAIYVLEDHSRDRWTLKHKVKSAVLFQLGKLPSLVDHNPVIAFHPTCDVFFLYDEKGRRLVSYDMREKRAHVVRSLEDVALVDVEEVYPFFFYVPFYSVTIDGQMFTLDVYQN
ncbi:unnamed protein product [Urochloa decumbens]|uniref:F-box protein At3g26010-like beta-propeller domain-containing protein n=1 Tax=Urochloa decumbens TaxID=240449 RepID=A0ABC9FRS3_9POAL